MRKLASPVFEIGEPLLMFGLILAYIWKFRSIHPYAWVAIPALMILSHVLRRETPRMLGFDWRDSKDTSKVLAPALILIAVLLLAEGAKLRMLRQTGLGGTLLALAAYLPWGLAQEYALNGYFLNRFATVVSYRGSAILAALLFSAVHAPNLFLMAITLPLSGCAILFYRRTHNLYLLGIAHAAVGLLLFLAVPDGVSHHMRIGPGWFLPHPD